MTKLRAFVDRWVAFWDEREAPTVLAILRIAVATVIAYDLVLAVSHDLVVPLWAPHAEGGIGYAGEWEPGMPESFSIFGMSASTSVAVFWTALASAVLFGAGVLTRATGAVCLLAYAQLAMYLPEGDRGVDVLLRHALVLLVLSGSGATLSVDARIRHGRFHRPDARVPSWPRRMLILQLVWMYFSAGMHKTQLAWTPFGGSTALYYILLDPHFARFDTPWLASLYPLTQLGTLMTMLFEWGAPLVLLAYWYERTRGRPGRVRRLFNGIRFRYVWIATGVAFHLMLALTLRLGIFPWGVLALYPAFVTPPALDAALKRLSARISSTFSTRKNEANATPVS